MANHEDEHGRKHGNPPATTTSTAPRARHREPKEAINEGRNKRWNG